MLPTTDPARPINPAAADRRSATFMRRIAGLALALTALTAAAALAPARSHAASRAWTTPGAVTLGADGRNHHFVIWNSLDAADRENELSLSGPGGFDPGAAEIQAGQLEELAESQVDEGLTDAKSKQDELTRLLAGITLTPAQKQAVDNLRAEIDNSMELYRKMHDVSRRMREVSDSAPNFSDLSAEQKANYRAIQSEMSPLVGEAREKMYQYASRGSELLDLIEAEADPAIKTHLKQIFDRENDLHHDLKNWASKGRGDVPTRGAATLSLLYGLAASTATAYAMQWFVGMPSSRGVVIEDTTGNPITPIPPLYGMRPNCRSIVRKGGTEQLSNAVWCPEPYLPNLIQVPDFRDFAISSQLIVEGGDGNDIVDLRLDWPQGDANSTSFGTTFVDTGAGNDTIYGSDLDDHLSGGAGFDTIVGGSGSDRIYGDNAFFNVGVDDAQANDRLCGGAGSDFVDGQLGDDLVFGGADDDTRALLDVATGAALKGGRGNDTLVGGSGVDDLDGGYGRDSIFARERPVGQPATGNGARFKNCVREAGPGNSGTTAPGADVADSMIDCGFETGPIDEYFEIGNAVDGDGDRETPINCTRAPRTAQSLDSLAGAYPDSSGVWPWF